VGVSRQICTTHFKIDAKESSIRALMEKRRHDVKRDQRANAKNKLWGLASGARHMSALQERAWVEKNGRSGAH
jgi:hypothetical protein